MMKIHLPSWTMGISFRHPYTLAKDKCGRDVKTPYKTVCDIYESTGETTALVASASARCVPPDQFNKETGRKMALTRALKQITMGKLERRLVWKAYLERGVKE